MDQNIGALRKTNEILRVSRVARKHYGVSGKIDAIAKRWLNWTVVNRKRCNLDPGTVVYDALLDVLRPNIYAERRQFVVLLANLNIKLEGFLQVRHHFLGSGRAPYFQRNLTAARPTGKPQIRNPHHMIGMQMSE